MSAASTTSHVSSLAATVAPEDIHCGDFVSPLNTICEYPSFYWNRDASTAPPDEPVRSKFRAHKAGVPWRVKAVCLPFVFVKTPRGRRLVLDIRRFELVRLSDGYAKRVWKHLKRRKRNRRNGR